MFCLIVFLFAFCGLVQEVEDSPCVDLGSNDLYALYTGYSRGKDLVGGYHGDVTAAEIVSPGQAYSEAYEFYGDDVQFDVDACSEAQTSAAATSPDFDNSLVGGVGWDFNGDSIAYYFGTGPDFVLPREFTIEFWMYPRETKGYVLSFASDDNQNCLLLQNSKITTLHEWHHIVVVTEKNGYVMGHVPLKCCCL